MSRVSAVVKGRTSELLVSFVRFGSLVVWTLSFLPDHRVLVPSWGILPWSFYLAVQCGGLWDVTCLRCFFGGSVFFIFERGGIMFAATDSPPQSLLDHVLLLTRNYSY